MGRAIYASDLTDCEWEMIAPLLPTAKTKPRKIDLREVVNAIFYMQKTGCQWRMLPHDLPHWTSVAYYYYPWVKIGLFDQIREALARIYRAQKGKNEEPSVLIIDSQSVKSDNTCKESGYDGNKKIKGIKRHIIVDTLGIIWGILVSCDSVQDRDGGKILLNEHFSSDQACKNIELILADEGYRGNFVKDIEKDHKVKVIIGKKPNYSDEDRRFKPARSRWVVERTFAWLTKARRLAKDYERTSGSAKAMISIRMIRLLAKWTAHKN